MDSSFDLSGSLLDIVNYALSLDLSGRLPIADAHGNAGWLLFAGRRLRNVILGETEGQEALRALAGGAQVNCSFDEALAGEEGGPLSLDYAALCEVLERLQQEAVPRRRKTLPKEKLEPRRVSPAAVRLPAGPAFPALPKDVFPNDRDVRVFGTIIGDRVQCYAVNMASLPAQKLRLLIRQIRNHAESARELAAYLPDRETADRRYTQIVEVPGNLLGVLQEDGIPWTLFVICRKPDVLGHTLLLGRLEMLIHRLNNSASENEA